MADSTLPDAILTHEPTEEIEAFLAPTRPKSLGFQLLYGLANATIGIGNITFYTLLLPARIALVAPNNQTNTFLLISGIGALASIFTNPIVGALSDRTTSLLGRRLPWLMVGMLLLLCAMLVLAYAPSLLLLGTGSVLLQIAINVILAALSAIIPDQVPLPQRATVSAFGGMAPLVGGLIGQILVSQVIKDLTASFLILAIVSVALLIIFSLVLREQRLPKHAVTPFQLADIPKSLWLNPRKHPDFARAWLARCFVFLASTTVINYLFYYLIANHVFPQAQVSRGVQLFYTAYVLSILVTSLVFGKLSDTFQCRKPFVIIASLLMTVGILLLAVFPTWHLILVGAMVLGSGFGGYLSTDLALASQLLPEARNRGKDFGLINTAIFLPMVVAPLLAGITVGLFQSYTALFVVIAVGTILAAGIILPIKQVS